MTNNKKAGHYIRKNKNITAVIYISGERQIEQKLFCQMYALENHYHVLNITENIEDIDNCDVIIISNRSKFLKLEEEHNDIVSELRNKGIKIEVAVTDENAGKYLDYLTKLSKTKL